MAELSVKERRKYAVGMSALKNGVRGYETSLFKAIHLTTRLGDDNSVKRFTSDFRKLIRWIRSMGYEVQYCGAMGYTPKNELLHYHGLLRVKGGFLKLYEGEIGSTKVYVVNGEKHSEHKDKNRRALGDKWNKIHNAFSVELDDVESQEDIQKYITKHILKDYVRAEFGDGKFLVSGGWRKKIPQQFIKDFKKWLTDGLDIYPLNKEGWRALNELIELVLDGNKAELKMPFGTFVVTQGFKFWGLVKEDY